MRALLTVRVAFAETGGGGGSGGGGGGGGSNNGGGADGGGIAGTSSVSCVSSGVVVELGDDIFRVQLKGSYSRSY